MDAREFEKKFKEKSISLEREQSKIALDSINCIRCFDSGFSWIDVDGIPAWVYCRCKEGKQKACGQPWALPDYDYQMEQLFKAKPFPVRAFIPSPFDSMKVGMEKKMRDFKADLRLSEKFWKQFSLQK